MAAGDLVRLAERIPTERLEAQIGELAAHLTAATCRFLVLIGESDRRRAWASWGMASCAHWLSWHCGLGLGTAREHVRVARAMRGLPQLSAEFAAGRLSYSKMRAVTRIATPALESELLAIALASTASQVDRWVSGYRRAKRQEQTEDRARAKAAQKSPAPNPTGTEDAKSTAEPATAADTASPPAPSAEGPDAPVGPEVPLAGGLEQGDVSGPIPTGAPVSDESLERTSPGDPDQETVSAAEVESWGKESGIDRAELTWYFDEGGDFIMKARLPAEEGQLLLAALEAARATLGAPVPRVNDCTATGAAASAGHRQQTARPGLVAAADSVDAHVAVGGDPVGADPAGLAQSATGAVPDGRVRSNGEAGGSGTAGRGGTADSDIAVTEVRRADPDGRARSGGLESDARVGSGSQVGSDACPQSAEAGRTVERSDAVGLAGGDTGVMGPGGGATRAGRPVSNAEALMACIRSALVHAPRDVSGLDRFAVVVQVDRDALLGEDTDVEGGRCQVRDGTAIPVETAWRIACDATLRAMYRDAEGRPVNFGDAKRFATPAQRRLLRERDGGCAFPGCSHQRYLHAHHVRHWIEGGPTDLDNLVLLCSLHHRLVHEGGVQVRRRSGGDVTGRMEPTTALFTFHTKDGRLIVPTPQRQVRTVPLDRLRGDLYHLPEVDPDTLGKGWQGDRLDVNAVIAALDLANSRYSAGARDAAA